MRIFITFVLSIFLFATASAVEIMVTGVDAAGSDNDGTWFITYQTGTYDSLEATIDSNNESGNLWWWGDASDSQTIANAANVNNLRFPSFESSFSGQDTINYYDTNGLGQVFQSASASYVINASRVPAPLPILGIIPFVSFLRKMRKKQKLIS